MGRREHERELLKLQVELCELQEWVKQKGLRVLVVFEGRDGAGKAQLRRPRSVSAPACSAEWPFRPLWPYVEDKLGDRQLRCAALSASEYT